MGHRLSSRWGRLGLEPSRVIDTHAYQVELSGKASSLSDLLADMDQARVTTSLVLVQEDTAEFFRLAARHPGRLYGVACYDSRSPHEGLVRLQAVCEDHSALILGVAIAFPHFRQDPRLKDFVPLYEYCMRRGFPVHFQMRGDPTRAEVDRPTAFGVLARSYPALKIVCRSTGAVPGEMAGLLCRFPNLYLQVTALDEAGAEQRAGSLTFRALLRAAGSRKLMFGSGWRGRETDYLRQVEAVRRLPWWQRRHIGWRTAASVYGPRILGDRGMETGVRNV